MANTERNFLKEDIEHYILMLCNVKTIIIDESQIDLGLSKLNWSKYRGISCDWAEFFGRILDLVQQCFLNSEDLGSYGADGHDYGNMWFGVYDAYGDRISDEICKDHIWGNIVNEASEKIWLIEKRRNEHITENLEWFNYTPATNLSTFHTMQTSGVDKLAQGGLQKTEKPIIRSETTTVDVTNNSDYIFDINHLFDEQGTGFGSGS